MLFSYPWDLLLLKTSAMFFSNGIGFGTAIGRMFTAVPGHLACFAVFMGFFYSKAKYAAVTGKKGKSASLLLLSFAIPSLIHGVYDAIIMARRNFRRRTSPCRLNLLLSGSVMSSHSSWYRSSSSSSLQETTTASSLSLLTRSSLQLFPERQQVQFTVTIISNPAFNIRTLILQLHSPHIRARSSLFLRFL